MGTDEKYVIKPERQRGPDGQFRRMYTVYYITDDRCKIFLKGFISEENAQRYVHLEKQSYPRKEKYEW